MYTRDYSELLMCYMPHEHKTGTDLQTRVQLEEVEPSVLLVEVLHCASTHIAHHLGQTNRSLQHRQVG